MLLFKFLYLLKIKFAIFVKEECLMSEISVGIASNCPVSRFNYIKIKKLSISSLETQNFTHLKTTDFLKITQNHFEK